MFLSFVPDALFSVAAALAFLIYLYEVNRCRFRWYLLLSAAAGFALYALTASRIVMFLVETAVGAVQLAMRYLARRLRPVVKKAWLGVKKAAGWLWHHTVFVIYSAASRRRARCRTVKYQKALPLLLRVPEEMR